METKELAFFVLVDESGDFVVAKDRDELQDKWEEEIGGVCVNSRVLSLSIQVEVAGDVKLSATVPAQKLAAKLAVK